METGSNLMSVTYVNKICMFELAVNRELLLKKIEYHYSPLSNGKKCFHALEKTFPFRESIDAFLLCSKPNWPSYPMYLHLVSTTSQYNLRSIFVIYVLPLWSGSELVDASRNMWGTLRACLVAASGCKSCWNLPYFQVGENGHEDSIVLKKKVKLEKETDQQTVTVDKPVHCT